jgi:preprotein translocase subunit SecF
MSRRTYSEAANRAVNQTLVRSLNTSLASLLPIFALLVVGAFLLGAETIKDLSLALFVGVAAGTYSSIFIATPVVALWKETEPRNRALRARVERLAATAPVGAEPRTARQAQPVAPAQRRRRGAGYGPPAEEVEPAAAEGRDGEEPSAAELEEQPAAAVPAARRQTQKPRQAQQRRKSSGRQPSRSAKRRRR